MRNSRNKWKFKTMETSQILSFTTGTCPLKINNYLPYIYLFSNLTLNQLLLYTNTCILSYYILWKNLRERFIDQDIVKCTTLLTLYSIDTSTRFYVCCSRQHLKTLWQRKKLLLQEHFFPLPQCFQSFLT